MMLSTSSSDVRREEYIPFQIRQRKPSCIRDNGFGLGLGRGVGTFPAVPFFLQEIAGNRLADPGPGNQFGGHL